MSPSQNINAVAWRGLLIAMLLLALCIAGFALVSSGGHIRTPAFIDQIAAMMSPPTRFVPAKKAHVTSTSVEQVADPGARSGLSRGMALGAGGTGGGAAQHSGPAPGNAAQALQQVLHEYRNDPKHTATVTISSTGRITQSAAGPLTAHDGLPIDALNGSTEIQGSASGAAPAP